MSPAELKEWRRSLGLTQEQAAGIFRVSRVTEQNWESGTTPVPDWADDRRESYEWNRRQSRDFGPVILSYLDNPNYRISPATYHPERFATNEFALERACELWGKPGVYHMSISDDDSNPVWLPSELEAKVLELLAEKRAAKDKGRTRTPEEIAAIHRAIKEIQEEVKKLPVLDPNFTDKDLYDEHGLPK